MLEARADQLVQNERLLPAERQTVLALCYTLRGLGDGEGGVRAYSDEPSERKDAVEALFEMLEGRGEIGLTRQYSQADGHEQEEMRLSIPGDASVNNDSAELAQRITAFQRAHNISSFGEAMLKYDERNKGNIKSYASTSRN